jgi:hypothetical protein
MSVTNLFLPKIIITSPDTAETIREQILDVIANMRIGRVVLFDLNFSKKHMHNYAYIDLIMNDNEAAARFLQYMSERGFAKIRDETHYWKVCNYVSPKHRFADEVSVDEESSIVDEWDEPSEQYLYNDFVEQTAKMAHVLKENVVRGLSLMELDLTDEILASMIGTSNHMIGTSNHMIGTSNHMIGTSQHMICEQSDSIHTYLNADLLMCL